jgi:hypothetical protein
LAASLERGEFDQLLFLHTARANLILADFVREIFWPRYSAGRDTLTREDAMEFVGHAVREGKTQSHWADSTIRRVSAYLLGSCADFGLLAGSSRGPRTIQPLRLSTKTAAYLAYDLRSRARRQPGSGHTDWQLFGLEWADVRDQFKRLALEGFLILQTAGDVTHVSWTTRPGRSWSMSSLDSDFNELMARIRHGREFGHASFEPIFYLVFHPSQILEVKRRQLAWKSRLANDGWDVHSFSIADEVADILATAPLRKIWLAADQRAPQAWAKTNASLSQCRRQRRAAGTAGGQAQCTGGQTGPSCSSPTWRHCIRICALG